MSLSGEWKAGSVTSLGTNGRLAVASSNLAAPPPEDRCAITLKSCVERRGHRSVDVLKKPTATLCEPAFRGDADTPAVPPGKAPRSVAEPVKNLSQVSKLLMFHNNDLDHLKPTWEVHFIQSNASLPSAVGKSPESACLFRWVVTGSEDSKKGELTKRYIWEI